MNKYLEWYKKNKEWILIAAITLCFLIMGIKTLWISMRMDTDMNMYERWVKEEVTKFKGVVARVDKFGEEMREEIKNLKRGRVYAGKEK